MDSHIHSAEPAASRPLRLSSRQIVGLLIFGLGALVILNSALAQLAAGSPQMKAALMGSGMAAAATALGTLPILFAQAFSQRTHDCFLGFGAGVMLGATAFSLIMPALNAAEGMGIAPMWASSMVGGGVLAGAVLLVVLDRMVHVDPARLARPGVSAGSLRRAWMFVSVVALHNLPEGLAIGVAYAGPDIDSAHSLATGISIQDVPEGLVVAMALRSVGYGRLASAGLGAASGLVEPLAAMFGVALIGISADLLPIGLAAAAGAMLLVIVQDVIPESHKNGHGRFASMALVCGFILMTVLDTALA